MRPNIIRRGIFNFLKNNKLEHVLADKAESKPTENSEFAIHYPVHLETTIRLLKENKFVDDTSEKSYDVKSLLDCTLGTGGHAKRMLHTFQNLYM